jgi:catechol 2,3-dioxygenase-like lactoylglutathione lyase family enzyme
MEAGLSTDAVVLGIHHSGISVEDLDTALAFWEPFLGTRARFRGRLDRPYLARSVGYPGVAIEAALFDLPDGRMVELLDYQVEGRERQPDDSFHPGHTHTCLTVSDCNDAWRRAVDAGAIPRSPDGPVEVDAGPNKGALVCYLRLPDGNSLELFQPTVPLP